MQNWAVFMHFWEGDFFLTGVICSFVALCITHIKYLFKRWLSLGLL